MNRMREGRCNVEGPDGCYCLANPDRHGADHACDHQTWPSAEWTGLSIEESLTPPKERREAKKKMADDIGERTRERERVEREGRGPEGLVRGSDPATSRQAIYTYEPKRSSAKGRVLIYLLEHISEWVDAPVLHQPEIGSFAGTRRMRELRRDHNYPIETRKKPGGGTTWQHRMVPESEYDRSVDWDAIDADVPDEPEEFGGGFMRDFG